MTLELNIAADFATIVDATEPLTLKRRDSAATIAIARAWRSSASTTDAEPSGGHVAQADVVWQFAWESGVPRPRLGDALIDAAGECFTILLIDNLLATGRVRCAARILRLVYSLYDRVDVQIAVIEDSGGGPEITGWQTIRAALPARIQPDQLEVDNTTDPATATETHRILLGEQLTLDANTRFVSPAGDVYQLIEYLQAERIDALPVARVVKLPAGVST
jgi:hypothetical protein